MEDAEHGGPVDPAAGLVPPSSPSRDLAEAFESASQAGTEQSVMADALHEQTEAIKVQTGALMEFVRGSAARAQQPRSAMKVQPNVKWPIIDDSTTDPEEWKIEFERVCKLQGYAKTDGSVPG